MQEENKITYFAQTDSRNKRVNFGIKSKDRTRHVYVIGKTGMGKSTLLENMAIQDIQNGNGLAFIDPHGKTAELLLEYVPEERIKDVLYFAPFDMEYPISFNVMEDVGPDKRHLVANGLMSTFEKIWVDAWSARMAYILNNSILALLEYPGATLLGINRMLADKKYREKVVANITDPSVKSFWIDEFGKYTERFAAEATPAIQNKVGQFTSNPLIRNIIGQSESTFDLRKMMDEKKIIIINLSKGRVGEGNANLLGSMLITKIYLAAMSRADVSERELNKLPNFYLFVDEFQSFANKSFADILSEARKYKLNLTIAHQYIEQMEEEVRAAVFGNVGTMVAFRVGAYDAEVLEKEFAPQFTAEDIVNLGIFQIYLKLMIDGVGSSPFSATTMPPIKRPEISFRDEIVSASREQFAKPRAVVEEEIRKWHEPIGGISTTVKPGGQGGGGASSQNHGTFSSVRRNERNERSERDGGNFTKSFAPKKEFQNDRPNHKFKDELREIKEKLIKGEEIPGVASQEEKNIIAEEKEFAKKEVDNRKPISLQELVPKKQENKNQQKPVLNPKKNDGRGPSKENLNSLREALASVMKESKKEENPISHKKSEQKDVTKKESFSPKGIPDDELKKMLDVSEE